MDRDLSQTIRRLLSTLVDNGTRQTRMSLIACHACCGNTSRWHRRIFVRVLARVPVVALLSASLVTFARSSFAQAGTFVPTGSMNVARTWHTATLLNNGQVLIAGGSDYGTNSTLASAELYDPATQTFTFTGSLNTAREAHTATLLNNGMVLIAGGAGTTGGGLTSAELYDPTTGTFTVTGSLNTARPSDAATLLTDGTVLFAGGQGYGLNDLASAELYNPATGTFTYTGNMNAARALPTATLLQNGTVLVAGGSSGINELASAEVYDPSMGSFTLTGNMNYSRGGHSATLLNNGTVLVAGGLGVSALLTSAELYDPATQTFTFTGSLNTARETHTATLLNNGTVLIAGGSGLGGILASAELYDPTTGTFTSDGTMNNARDADTATLLNDGTVLIAGGYYVLGGGQTSLATAQVYQLFVMSSTSLSFPSQAVGITSAPQTVAFTNNESTALTVTSVSIIGTNAPDFAETNNCVGSVAAGASCTISVTFTPSATGMRTAALSIAANTINPPAVTLNGTGVPTAPIVSLSPLSLAFVSPSLGTVTPAQTVTLSNTGTANLNIQTIALGGASAAEFAFANGATCANGGTLAPNSSCLVQLTFTPSLLGTSSAMVVFTDNAADSPETVGLSGTVGVSPVVSITPSSVSFPTQYVDTSGLPQTVTVTNIGGASLTITSVTVSPADFGVLNACGSVVVAGSSCAIGVFFDPTTSGTRTGTLTLNDNAGGPQTVPLTGAGQDFSMAPSGASSATVSPGQTASYVLAVAPGGGFNGTVFLSCIGAPAQSTCFLSPASVALGGSKPTSVTVRVTTAGVSARVAPFPVYSPGREKLALWLTLPGMSGLLLLGGSTRRGRKKVGGVFYAFVLLGILCSAITCSSCGSGGGSTGSGGGTPAGTYNLTVIGSFTSGSTTLTHNTKLTLVVN